MSRQPRGNGVRIVARRLAVVAGAMGRLLMVFGAVLALPALVGACCGEAFPAAAFLETACLVVAAGWALQHWLPRGRLGKREAVLLCTGAWVVCSLVAAAPVSFGCDLPYGSALFECVSGLTTTGLTCLRAVEEAPRTLVFWRSLSQLLGGLGILSFFLLVSFPGSAAHRLFSTEGAKTGAARPTPSLRRTIGITWVIYGLLVATNFLVLLILGAGFLDSLNLSFTTASTGGFAPYDLGVGHYRAAGHPQARAIELATLAFMALGGLNFLLHYRALTGRVAMLFSGLEARHYWTLILLGMTLIALESLTMPRTWEWLSGPGAAGQLSGAVGLETLRLSSFQAVSLTSGAGHLTLPLGHPFFGPAARQLFLLLLMVGGCVGSTTGGVKVLRMVLLGRSLGQEVRKLAFPEGATLPVVTDGQVISTASVQPVAAMVFAWIILALGGGVVLAATSGQGPFECLTLSMSALSNTGPSLMPATAIPTLPTACQALLMAWMIMGRLEVLPVLALFLPRTWRH